MSPSNDKKGFAGGLRFYSDIVLKLTPAIASFLAAWIAIQYQTSSTGASLLNQREQAETQLRATMFSNLISPIVSDSNKKLELEEQKLLVEMLALNFHEHVEIKPLLLFIDNKLTNNIKQKSSSADSEKSELMRDSMISVVRRVRDRQLAILQKECRIRGGSLCPEQAAEERNNCLTVPANINTAYVSPSRNPQCLEFLKYDAAAINQYSIRKHSVDSPDRKYRLELSIEKSQWEEKSFTINVWIYKYDKDGYKVQLDQFDFDLTQFDLPFTDNTILDDTHRFALVLKKVSQEAKQLQLHVVWFPEGYILPYERPVNFQEIREVLNLK